MSYCVHQRRVWACPICGPDFGEELELQAEDLEQLRERDEVEDVFRELDSWEEDDCGGC